MRTREQIEYDIATTQERVEGYKRELGALEVSTIEGFTDRIHGMLCRDNHCDGCGYEYESWSTNHSGGTRARWRDRATKLQLALRKIRPDLTPEEMLAIVTAVTGGR